jgi:Ca-activated chloride channel family protein
VLRAVYAQQAVAPVAQKPAEIQDDSSTRIILDVTRVNMLFTVTDKKGRFVTDLTKDDFQVFENKKPQTIAEFTAETDLPLRLGILIDTSNSIRERFKFEQEAANSFINSVVRQGHDKAMVVSFDTSAELVADLTDDTEKLQNAVRSLRPGGGTALYDAIYFACRDKLAKDQPRHKFRRAIVDRQRRRRQPEPGLPRPGARNGAEGRCGDLRDFDQRDPRRNRWRQDSEIPDVGNRRPGLLPL